MENNSLLRKNLNLNTVGFTLIEVLLAITILSTLSLLSTQAISRALKARTKIQLEIDDVSSLRDAMRMMRTDLNLAFHLRDFEQEIADLVTKKSTTGTPATAGGAPSSNNQRQTKRQDPTTHFSGDNDKMNFITLNNGRITANAIQADFIEVGYEVKNCKNLSSQKDSDCLFRRVQTVLDDDVTKGGNEIVLLENISEFKLRYIGEGKQEWANTWKSTSDSSDEVTKGKYPESVEITLGIERDFEGKKRKYDMNFVVPIHFPNNLKK